MRRWGLPILLMVATFFSTLHVGAQMVLGANDYSLSDIWSGWVFAVPLMAILMAHEFGHYIAGRIHRVDISPPFFIPMPYFLLGTMGAVIRMRGAIRSRNALLDVGAAGPLAGLVVAIPVLAYGIATSPVEPLPEAGTTHYLMEGRSLLYWSLLVALKGQIPSGSDIMLNPTAFAGWAGLLITMINLLPFGQLDGGHVGYALLGVRQDRVSRGVLRALPVLAFGVGLYYGIPSYLRGADVETMVSDFSAGVQWLVWGGVLFVMALFSGWKHPPTSPQQLSERRRAVAILTLACFALLFMPSWLRLR